MRAQEAFFSGNTPISATPARFTVTGGRYGLDLHASVWGTATLNKVGQDGSTLIKVLNPFSADGSAIVDLPPGLYELTLSGITNLVWCVARVPMEE